MDVFEGIETKAWFEVFYDKLTTLTFVFEISDWQAAIKKSNENMTNTAKFFFILSPYILILSNIKI
jgi:hypothetical protein